MGIIEKKLSTTSLKDGKEILVEYNKGDVIHLHIGDFRLDFSPEEFRKFSEAVKQGKRDLIEVKDGI